MHEKDKFYLKIFLLIPLSIFAFTGITIFSLIFSYFNQSSLTPADDRLRFFNYLFPYFLTVGFIFYFTLFKINNYKSNSINWIWKLLILILAIVAVQWQFKHLIWLLQKKHFGVIEFVSFAIAATFTIATLFLELKGINKKKNVTQQQV